jgi:DNA-binding CsgD family transcriptional regulator
MELTPDEARRSARALAAGRAKLQAGALDDALRLATTAESGALNDLQQAQSHLLRAQVSFLSTRGGDAAPLLLEAAERLRDLDPELSRETYLEALTAAIFAGRLAGPGASTPEVADAARAAPPAQNARGPDLLLDGLVALFSDSYIAAVPKLREAQRAIGDGMSKTEQLSSMWGANISSAHLWDDEAWERLSEQQLLLVRETGAFARLPIALSQRGQMYVFSGDLARAESFKDALEEATEISGSNLAPYLGAELIAMRGREPEARRFIDAARVEVTERGEGAGLSFLDWTESVLYNGLGRYAEALEAALKVVDLPELASVNWVLPEVIEAAVRTGEPELAVRFNRRLADRTQESGTDWALGIAARSHALVVNDNSADEHYTEAIERLGRTRVKTDLARAHLLYGEWLRRQRRRVDAREELRVAHEMFSGFGMEGFAGRAQVELQATGGRTRRQAVDTVDQLTSQESHVSRLAAQGHTNREIAGQLFISESTVEYHLVKAFRKLNIKSRSQLASRLQ